MSEKMLNIIALPLHFPLHLFLHPSCYKAIVGETGTQPAGYFFRHSSSPIALRGHIQVHLSPDHWRRKRCGSGGRFPLPTLTKCSLAIWCCIERNRLKIAFPPPLPKIPSSATGHDVSLRLGSHWDLHT